MSKLLWVACGLTALAIAAVLVWRPAPADPQTGSTNTAERTDTGLKTPEMPVVVDTDLETGNPSQPGTTTIPNRPEGGQDSLPTAGSGTAGIAAAPGTSLPLLPPETAEQRRAKAQAKAAQEAARRDWLNARVSPPAAGKTVPKPVLSLNLGAELGQKGLGVTEEIEIMHSIFTQFRRHYKENPVGENYEITATLTGANSKKIAYLSPDHASINERGELCDHWGNPFWFHSQSKDLMEVVSRGPDGELHTADDVKMK